MPFSTFLSNRCLSIDYDGESDSLFVSLHSKPQLPALTEINPLTKSALWMSGPTWCLVQDNLPVGGLDEEALDWLADQFLPALGAAGVEHWVWVCSSTLYSQHLVDKVASRLNGLSINVFHDLEHAVTWFQQARPAVPPTPSPVLGPSASATPVMRALLAAPLCLSSWVSNVA